MNKGCSCLTKMSNSNDSSSGDTTNSPAASRRQRVRTGIAKVGNTLQRFNLAKLIDDMEKDQEVADKLDFINQETKEENERKALVREATAKCQAEIENHLGDFLQRRPQGTYEDWIQELHPENVEEGKLLSDVKEVDLRFFVEDSDHRKLWNERVPEKYVPARPFQGEDLVAIDLVDNSTSNVKEDSVARISRQKES